MKQNVRIAENISMQQCCNAFFLSPIVVSQYGYTKVAVKFYFSPLYYLTNFKPFPLGGYIVQIK